MMDEQPKQHCAGYWDPPAKEPLDECLYHREIREERDRLREAIQRAFDTRAGEFRAMTRILRDALAAAPATGPTTGPEPYDPLGYESSDSWSPVD